MSATALALPSEAAWRPKVNPWAIAATVSTVGYLGGGAIVHLATNQQRALKAYLPGTAASSFARGTPVWATWPPEEGVVLTQ